MRNSNFNESFFDKWTEESAYILGFWYADGSINLHYNKSGNYDKVFRICNTDKQIMDNISAILNVSYSVGKPKNAKHKIYYIIFIVSNKIFDFCYSFIKSTDKTNNIKWPKIPDQYMNHFIRGFFDGDGSVYIKNYKNRHGNNIKNLSSSFAGSKNSDEFLIDLNQYLANKALVSIKNITYYSKTKKENSGNAKIIFNQYDTMLLCEWMYKDATIFMKRKKNIWDGFDKEKLKNSTKYLCKSHFHAK